MGRKAGRVVAEVLDGLAASERRVAGLARKLRRKGRKLRRAKARIDGLERENVALKGGSWKGTGELAAALEERNAAVEITEITQREKQALAGELCRARKERDDALHEREAVRKARDEAVRGRNEAEAKARALAAELDRVRKAAQAAAPA